MRKKETFVAYTVVIAIGLLMAAGVCGSKNILNRPMSEAIKILSDAFLLPAAMFCGLGGLVFASNNGIFNIMVYGTKSFFCHLFRRKEFLNRYKDYFEYNKEKSRESASFGFMLIPGIVFMILAVSFSIMHSSLI